MMLYAFHQGSGGFDTRLWCSTYVPGSGWQPDALTSLQDANGQYMIYSPSAVEYGGNIYAFAQSATGSGLSDSGEEVPPFLPNGNLLYEVYDGVTWGANTVGDVLMSQSPSAVIWNGRIHVFYQGSSGIASGNGTLHFMYFDGTNWQPGQQVPNVGMSESPSAVEYDGDLFVFHQGGYESGQLWYSTYVPGSGWQPDTQVPNVVGMSESPSAVVWNGDLHVFHQGIGEDGQLWFAYFDGTNWQPEQQVPTNIGMSKSPAMLATT